MKLNVWYVLAMSALLSACGGSGSNSDDHSLTPPPSQEVQTPAEQPSDASSNDSGNNASDSGDSSTTPPSQEVQAPAEQPSDASSNDSGSNASDSGDSSITPPSQEVQPPEQPSNTAGEYVRYERAPTFDQLRTANMLVSDIDAEPLEIINRLKLFDAGEGTSLFKADTEALEFNCKSTGNSCSGRAFDFTYSKGSWANFLWHAGLNGALSMDAMSVPEDQQFHVLRIARNTSAGSLKIDGGLGSYDSLALIDNRFTKDKGLFRYQTIGVLNTAGKDGKSYTNHYYLGTRYHNYLSVGVPTSVDTLEKFKLDLNNLKDANLSATYDGIALGTLKNVRTDYHVANTIANVSASVLFKDGKGTLDVNFFNSIVSGRGFGLSPELDGHMQAEWNANEKMFYSDNGQFLSAKFYGPSQQVGDKEVPAELGGTFSRQIQQPITASERVSVNYGKTLDVYDEASGTYIPLDNVIYHGAFGASAVNK